MNLTLLAIQPQEWGLGGVMVVAIIAAIYFGVTAFSRKLAKEALKRELEKNKPKQLFDSILLYWMTDPKTEEDDPLKDDPEAKKMLEKLVNYKKEPTEAELTAIKQEIAKLNPSYIELHGEIEKLKKEIEETPISENDQSANYKLDKKKQELGTKKENLAKYLTDLVKDLSGTPALNLVQAKMEMLAKVSTDTEKLQKVESLEKGKKELEEKVRKNDERIEELEHDLAEAARTGDSAIRIEIKELRIENYKLNIEYKDDSLENLKAAVDKEEFFINNAMQHDPTKQENAEELARVSDDFVATIVAKLISNWRKVASIFLLDGKINADFATQKQYGGLSKRIFDGSLAGVNARITELFDQAFQEFAAMGDDEFFKPENLEQAETLVSIMKHEWTSKDLIVDFAGELADLKKRKKSFVQKGNQTSSAPTIEPRTGPKPEKWQDIELTDKEKEQAGKTKPKQDDFKKKLFESWVVGPESGQQNSGENSTPSPSDSETVIVENPPASSVAGSGAVQSSLPLEQDVQ